MNNKQLQFAADTICSIADHLDMPDSLGSCFALVSSQESKMVHAITTDNSEEDLVDMFASALQADKKLLQIVVSAVVTAQAGMMNDEEDFGEDSTDSTDPRSREYWESKDLPRRAKIFGQLTEEQQLIFWQVEDAVTECNTEGAFLMSEIMSDPNFKGIAKDTVREILLAAGCILVKKRPELYDAADSIFILDA